ncbi:hypothetical protein D0T60_10170 [Bacteroides sp. 224]|nr:hypothetical protein [Bacteroides sp. 224]
MNAEYIYIFVLMSQEKIIPRVSAHSAFSAYLSCFELFLATDDADCADFKTRINISLLDITN